MTRFTTTWAAGSRCSAPIEAAASSSPRRSGAACPSRHVGTGLVDTRARYGADVVLVRPDQHIAWLGGRLSAPEADAVLDAVLHHGLLGPTMAPIHQPIRSMRN